GHPARRLAGRGTAAAAVVADAVLDPVAEVGMAGAELVLDVAVVFRTLILVLDQQTDRRSCGFAFEHAGENPDPVALAPLGHEARLARPAAVQPGLNVGLGKGDQRRGAIDDAADRRSMAFTPGREAKELAERVVRHRPWSSSVLRVEALQHDPDLRHRIGAQ